MVRRVLTAALACLLTFAPLLEGRARADVSELKIEQVQAELPELRAWFRLEGGEPLKEAVSATLDGRALQVEELRRYDPEKDVTACFFLVDCSTSTTYAQLEGVKESLRRFAGDMDENATMTLITFGVDVQVLLQRETDASAIEAAIDGLKADQPGTVFFDALAKAIDLASNKAYALERKLAFVFSDSVDYNLGGYTREEVEGLLSSAGLPFYALGFNTGGKQELDNFGALARASGGDISIVSAADMPGALEDMLELARSTWLARFAAGTNIIDSGIQEFALEIGDRGLTAAMQIPVRHWRPDNTAPEVVDIAQYTSESIRLSFSKPVAGAASGESYAVKNENGDLLGIRAAAYDEAGCIVTLTFTQPPETGTYTLECPGITDLSMERNKVAGAVSFSFEGEAQEPPEEPPAEEPEQEMSVGGWIVTGLIGLAIVAAALVMALRKKPRTQPAENAPEAPGQSARGKVERQLPGGEELQVHFSQSNAPLPKIKLQVTAASGEGRLVEIPVNKTLFVGRSDICDVYFDDPAMSRQHFVIAEENGLFTITNLSQTGGTVLNGVKLQNPRPLRSGDTIEAGGQNIVFLEVK